MANVALLFRAGPVKIDAIILDAALTEHHTGEVEVTEHPVEEGFNITDHSRPKPDSLTLEGIVSNTPLSTTQQRRIIDSRGQRLETATAEDQVQGEPGYAEAAYVKLRDLRDTGKVITVVTGLRTYDNMVMVSLSIPRDGRTGDALRFSAGFRQVRVVKTKATTFVVAKESKAKPTVKMGKQATKITAKETRKSIAIELKETAAAWREKLGI